MRKDLAQPLGTALAVLALASCGGGEDPPTGPPPPTSISLTSGGNQVGQVGQALGLPIVIRVSAGSQASVGTQITLLVTSGGGSLSRSTATTDGNGTVSVIWTLGGVTGPQTATATVGNLPPLQIQATAEVGPPALLAPTGGNSQFAVVGRPVAVKPRVTLTDAFGNPVPGRTVTFSVILGGGTITDPVQVTDGNGRAELGSWTLGPAAGLNRIRATLDQGLSAELVATGTPAVLSLLEGNNQSVNAGTTVPVAPAVLALDGDGNPLPGVAVTFQVDGGGGRVTLGSQTTDAQGIARVGGWILGLAPGENGLTATAVGVPAVRFTATGVLATPAGMTAPDGTGSSGLVGNFNAARPTVRLTDANGHPVAGIPVTFDVASGGGTVASLSPALGLAGSLAGATAVTDFDGRAVLGAWRLGPDPGAQSVVASAEGLAPITFTAVAEPIPPPQFNIEIRWVGTPPSQSQQAAFTSAVARWQEIILGDIDDIEVNLPASDFGCYPALNETIDDLVIYAQVTNIDGLGGILGQAGACLIRSDTKHSIVGRMQFDSADLIGLEGQGRLADVILHEMGHVLGIGSLWQLHGLVVGAGGGEPHFIGGAARSAWTVAAQTLGFTGSIVPIENTGGAGTRDVHWRESVARNELMTGFINQGVNPLSAITVGSLRDEGYVVNDAVADEFTLSALLQGLAAPSFELRESPLPGPILRLDRGGRVVGVLPRIPF